MVIANTFDPDHGGSKARRVGRSDAAEAGA